MTKLDSRWENDHHYIFVCECHDWHFIEVDWDEDDPGFRFLEITDTYHPRSWRERIKACWAIARRKPHYHSTVILNDHNIHELVAVLTKHHDADSTMGA